MATPGSSQHTDEPTGSPEILQQILVSGCARRSPTLTSTLKCDRLQFYEGDLVANEQNACKISYYPLSGLILIWCDKVYRHNVR